MVRISKELLRNLINEGFFDELRSIGQVVERLDEKGFTITGRKIGFLSQLLTFLCREGMLERKKDEKNKWSYQKLKND